MRCNETGLSVSYAYKKRCRCVDCKANKAKYTKNDTKASKRAKDWIQANKHMRKTYNERYTNLKYLESRHKFGDICNICGNGPGKGMSNSNKALHLDHCHKTGIIRGLLCGSCNVGLGHFKDNIDSLKKAVNYLLENGDVYEKED